MNRFGSLIFLVFIVIIIAYLWNVFDVGPIFIGKTQTINGMIIETHHVPLGRTMVVEYSYSYTFEGKEFRGNFKPLGGSRILNEGIVFYLKYQLSIQRNLN